MITIRSLLILAGLGIIVAAVVFWISRSTTAPSVATTPPATQPVNPTTAPTATIATQPAARDYMDVVRAAHPEFPTTQPLAFPLLLNQGAHLILHDPIYLDPIGHLWITRDDADPTPAVLKRAANEQVHVTRERVVYVHRWPDAKGEWQPLLVCHKPNAGFEFVGLAGRQNFGAENQYDWQRAFSWNEAIVVPALGGVSILRPDRRPVEVRYDFNSDNRDRQTLAPTQVMLDWQGLLAWIPWENGKTGSTGAARFINEQWKTLDASAGWPEKIIHLVPLLDGGVLQVFVDPEEGVADVALTMLDPPQVDEEQIRQLVLKLSDRDPQVRQASYEELTRYGSGSWPILEKLLPNQPPEASIRVQQLLLAKHEPSLGGMRLIPGKVRIVSRSQAGGAALLWSEAGVEIPRDDSPEEFNTIAPAWLAFIPGRAIMLAPRDMTADLNPDSAQIDIIRGEFIVTDDVRGPRWWLANHFSEPMLKQDQRHFSHVVGQDARGRWLFRKSRDADSPTLIIDPTLPDPTPRLPVWRFPVADGIVGWTRDGWPAMKSGGAFVLETSDWRPLDEKKERLFTNLEEMPPATPPPAPTTAPATQPSSLPAEPPVFIDADGTRYFDGRESLRVIRPDGSQLTWQLPDHATGSGDVWLLRAGDDRLFLFNEPGRVLRLKPQLDNAGEPFVLEATFTRRIPSDEHYNRVWLDPAGRIIISHSDAQTLSILFPTGRIPPDIAKKIPATELRETDEE